MSPNQNSVGGEINTLRKILRELKEIKELLQDDDPYDSNSGACCRNGCEKCEQ